MAGLQGRSVEEASLSKLQGKSIFGRFSDAEMLAQLKRLALDPGNSKVTHQKIRPLWDQTLRVRDAMTLADTDCPRRKRKLQQFVKDHLRSPPGLATEKSNQKSESKLSRGRLSHASDISCLLNSFNSTGSCDQKTILHSHSASSLLTFEDNFQGKLSSEFSLNDGIDFGPTSKDSCPLVDSDESVNGSNHLSPLLSSDDVVHDSGLLVERSRSRHLQPPRQSLRLLNFIGNNLQRLVVPVGPRFQADVPDWSDPVDRDNINDEASNSENSRWLGTRVWPTEIGNIKSTSKAIGKGRPKSCSCRSPGTTKCVRRHISEERLILQCELGPAFFIWNFHEMGEQVSDEWSSKDQETFKSLVKMKSQSYKKNFVRHALKSLPHKIRKNIVNYYFDVYIPKQLSLKTRSSVDIVDSDDDEAGDIHDTNSHKGSKSQNAKDLKSRYLRTPI